MLYSFLYNLLNFRVWKENNILESIFNRIIIITIYRSIHLIFGIDLHLYNVKFIHSGIYKSWMCNKFDLIFFFIIILLFTTRLSFPCSKRAAVSIDGILINYRKKSETCTKLMREVNSLTPPPPAMHSNPHRSHPDVDLFENS